MNRQRVTLCRAPLRYTLFNVKSTLVSTANQHFLMPMSMGLNASPFGLWIPWLNLPLMTVSLCHTPTIFGTTNFHCLHTTMSILGGCKVLAALPVSVRLKETQPRLSLKCPHTHLFLTALLPGSWYDISSNSSRRFFIFP